MKAEAFKGRPMCIFSKQFGAFLDPDFLIDAFRIMIFLSNSDLEREKE